MTRLSLQIIPNASKNAVVGKVGLAWKIRLAAPPVDGKANEKLVQYLADILDLAPSEIKIVRGHSSKKKVLDIPMHPQDVEEKLTQSTS